MCKIYINKSKAYATTPLYILERLVNMLKIYRYRYGEMIQTLTYTLMSKLKIDLICLKYRLVAKYTWK